MSRNCHFDLIPAGPPDRVVVSKPFDCLYLTTLGLTIFVENTDFIDSDVTFEVSNALPPAGHSPEITGWEPPEDSWLSSFPVWFVGEEPSATATITGDGQTIGTADGVPFRWVRVTIEPAEPGDPEDEEYELPAGSIKVTMIARE